MFLFSGLWEGENEEEEAKKKRDSVIANIMKDLIPLQKDIIIMERATENSRDIPAHDIIRIKSELKKSRESESRAIHYLAKLDKIIVPVPTPNDERKTK